MLPVRLIDVVFHHQHLQRHQHHHQHHDQTIHIFVDQYPKHAIFEWTKYIFTYCTCHIILVMLNCGATWFVLHLLLHGGDWICTNDCTRLNVTLHEIERDIEREKPCFPLTLVNWVSNVNNCIFLVWIGANLMSGLLGARH